MIRRKFCKTLALTSSLFESPLSISNRSVDITNSNFPKAPGLTKYVAEFVVNTTYEYIPEEVIDAVVKSEDVQGMLRRTNFHVDPEFNKTEGRGEDLQTVLVENGAISIHMKDGRTILNCTRPAKGSPKNPMTYEEVAEKFRANAEFATWPAQKAEFIIEQVKSMEKASDVSKLTSAFTS